jgi:hypothetical protein
MSVIRFMHVFPQLSIYKTFHGRLGGLTRKMNRNWWGLLFFLATLPKYIASRVFDQIPLKSPAEGMCSIKL